MKFIAGAILLLVTTSASAGTELGSIIKAALTQQKDSNVAWSFLAENGSPVNWETTGVDDGKRVGSAVISVGGFTPRVVSKSVQDAYWTVRLSGNKFGVSSITLNSEEACFGASAISENCIDNLSKIDASLKKVGINSQTICKFGPGSALSEVRRVSVPGHPAGYLHSMVNGGSGGHNLRVKMFFRLTDDASELEHATSVCALLFSANYGAESYISGEYKKQLIGKP